MGQLPIIPRTRREQEKEISPSEEGEEKKTWELGYRYAGVLQRGLFANQGKKGDAYEEKKDKE